MNPSYSALRENDDDIEIEVAEGFKQSKSANVLMYVGIAVGVLALIGLVYYFFFRKEESTPLMMQYYSGPGLENAKQGGFQFKGSGSARFGAGKQMNVSSAQYAPSGIDSLALFGSQKPEFSAAPARPRPKSI